MILHTNTLSGLLLAWLMSAIQVYFILLAIRVVATGILGGTQGHHPAWPTFAQ